jgi:hypothetical protein
MDLYTTIVGLYSQNRHEVSYPDIGRHIYKLINVLLL